MFLGWRKCFIDNAGMPVDFETEWVASCFILFTHVIYVGKVVHISELNKEL